MLRMTRAASLLASTLLILAACGPGGAGTSTQPSAAASSEPSTAASTEPSTEPSSSEGGEAYTVEAVENASLGTYLTGEDGKTLYVFTVDAPDTSNCNDACATAWPPFVVDAGETVEGGDGVTGMFATIARADGSMQVTYDHQPIYYYSGDAAAGDTNGQNMNNVWFVAPVSGTEESPSASPSKGNY